MPFAPIRFSERSRRTTDSPITYFIRLAVENPRMISLAAGLVDPVTLPAAEVLEAAESVLGHPGLAPAALQYGTTRGLASLREKVLDRVLALDNLSPRAAGATADDVVITTGSEQLLYLLSEMLLDPGDIVITEAPSYFVFQGTLASAGARVLSVPMDDEGMNTDALAELLARLERAGDLHRVRMIYLVDYFQNPTGLTLSLKRREHLLELARKYSKQQRIIIVEDAAYRELRYEGTDLPSLKSLDHDHVHVVLAMTFSKPLSPGLKTGYGILPHDLVAPLLHIKGNHDFGSNNFAQHLVDNMLDTGAYDRHLAELCTAYRAKRDALLEALEAEMGDDPGVHWTHPAGGLYVWLTLPAHIATGPGSALMDAALREEVLYVPGEFCYLGAEHGPIHRNQARLSFGVADCSQIREGIRRLARAIRSVSGHSIHTHGPEHTRLPALVE